MIEKGASNWDRGLYHACIGGYMEVALLMIEKGASNFDQGLIFSERKNKDLSILLIEKGANIHNCDFDLTEFDIEYLAYKNVKYFGEYQDIACLCMKRRNLADQVFKELNLRDIDSVIYTY